MNSNSYSNIRTQSQHQFGCILIYYMHTYIHILAHAHAHTQCNSVECCQMLIQAGTNLNSQDPTNGRTPLHYSCQQANPAIIELLLRSGALLDTMDTAGLMPLHYAAIIESKESLASICKVLGNSVLDLPDANGMTTLMHACSYGNEENAKFLLKKKVK